jgi:RNA polymerase sigma-70 factor (ECF subfamily)
VVHQSRGLDLVRNDALSTASDTPDAPSGLRTVKACGPIIELVTSTGSREPAVLVYRSAGVDETALAALCDVTAPRVYGLAVRILRSPIDVEEGPRDPYLEVWRTSTSFDADRNSSMAWIMAIAHRRAVDRLRSAHAPSQPRREGDISPLGRRAGRLARRQVRAGSTESVQVRDALDGLSPEQRDALELAHFDGYARAEPADLSAVLATLVSLTAEAPDQPTSQDHQR